MGIEYSGASIIQTTFSINDIASYTSGLAAALVSAGWTQVSSSPWIMQSGENPQGRSVRLRYCVFTGSLHRLYLESSDGLVVANPDPTAISEAGVRILPAAGVSLNIIASPFQFFMFDSGAPASYGRRILLSVPWLPPHLSSVTNAALLQGDTIYVSSGSGANISWRCAVSSYVQVESIFGSFYYHGYTTSSGDGRLTTRLGGMQATYIGNSWNANPATYYELPWMDGSWVTVDPWVGWNTGNDAAFSQWVGKLWDTLLISKALALDSTETFDGKNWQVVGSSSVAMATYGSKQSLLTVIP